jgi:RNA polymerase sigma-70 factor (ECF subfamily)
MILSVTEVALSDAFTPSLDAARAYEQYGRYLWRTLFRLGIREADLPDALQDVLVVVHRRGPARSHDAHVAAWLFEICRRVAAARRRKAYVRHEISDHDVESVDGNDPERLESTRRARVRLARVLDELNAEHRVVFVMFEIEGLSCPEIAEELDVPVGTVYSRLHAARRNFQKALKRLKVIEQGSRRQDLDARSSRHDRGEP